MKDFYIQELRNYNSGDELQQIGFDELYLDKACAKYEFKTLKIYSVKAIEANIIKQAALSLGADCAVHRNVILNEQGQFDCILCASISTLLKIAEKLQNQQFRLKNIGAEIIKILEQKKSNIVINDYCLDFNQNRYIMGILNITPDSFSDGGKYFDEKAAIVQYKKLVTDGADIIDIGAQSTKPNYTEIDTEEEIKRLKLLFNNEEYSQNNTLKSIDTYQYKVAEYALNNGVNIINDVQGFTDKNMIKLAADVQVPIIVMFNQKILPRKEETTFSQIYKFFVNKLDELISSGVKKENIILDCGFGFLNNNQENILMLENLSNFESLNCPMLLGISRKSFLNFISETENKDTLSLVLASKYIKNVDIIRVHDVKSHLILKSI